MVLGKLPSMFLLEKKRDVEDMGNSSNSSPDLVSQAYLNIKIKYRFFPWF